MDRVTAAALSNGVLIAIWTYLSLVILPDLSPWVGIAAWGCFYATGGRTQGFQRTLYACLSGMIYVWALMQLLPRFGGSALVYALLMGIVALLVVIQSKLPQLSFIPGAFVGAAVTVGNGSGADLGHLLYVGLSLVLGTALGLAAETTAASLAARQR